jgi:hypothetical protein
MSPGSSRSSLEVELDEVAALVDFEVGLKIAA